MNLTSRDAAAILGMNERTVRKWCQAGRIRKAKKHGPDWVIPSASIDGLLPGAGGKPTHKGGPKMGPKMGPEMGLTEEAPGAMLDPVGAEVEGVTE